MGKKSIEGKLRLQYPIDHRDLTSVYANHVQMYELKSGEVLLDLGNVQPQTGLTPDGEKLSGTIDVQMVMRIILPLAVAKQLSDILKFDGTEGPKSDAVSAVGKT